MKYVPLLLSVMSLSAITMYAEEARKVKHESTWQALIEELKKFENVNLAIPTTPSDAAALQARGISNILQGLQNIQNSVLNIQNNNNEHTGCQCHCLTPEQIEQVLHLLKTIEAQVHKIAHVVGSLDDESVSDQSLSTVQAIDQAQLTLVSWAKTIYRHLNDVVS